MVTGLAENHTDNRDPLPGTQALVEERQPRETDKGVKSSVCVEC